MNPPFEPTKGFIVELYQNYCPNESLLSSAQRSIRTSPGSRGIGNKREGLNPADVKICPADVKICPADVKICPAEVKINPAEVKINPADVKICHAETKICPAEQRIIYLMTNLQ